MTSTPDLILALASSLTPVRRLRPPLVRAVLWLMLAALVLALLTISQGVRPDLSQRLLDPAFVASVAGALLTGILAAIAAFIISLPDRSRLWVLLPLPGLILWFANVGYQCLTNWVAIDFHSMTFGATAECFATLVLASLPLSLAMMIMLRRARPLRPTSVTLIGSISVAGLTAAALSVFHVLDASVMILMWNIGTAMLLVGLGWIFRGMIGTRVAHHGRELRG